MAGDRPNIVIFYADQMRGDSLSCAGNRNLKTPQMDRLAFEGAHFVNAFPSYPLCSPFRASLFTGKYAHSTGVYANHYAILLSQDFLANIFRAHGYKTGYFGKWHLDGGAIPGYVPPGNRRLGFDQFVGFNRGHHYFSSIYFKDTGQPYTSRRYEPDYQTDQLLEFLEHSLADPNGGPFLAMINYGLPHPPLLAPDHYLHLYSPDEISIPENVPKDKNSQQAAKEFLARYYGLIACVDHNIGRVLDWIDHRNLTDNTVVILMSDHGELAGEHGLYGKKTYYRGATHVPLLVRYPKRVPPGHVVNGMIDPAVDTMPTMLELCGLPVPKAVQGVSFLSLLEGENVPTRGEVYYEILMEKEGPEKFPVPERGVRTLDWLYVRNRAAPVVLFDLNADPLEMENLVHSVDHQAVIEKLDLIVLSYMHHTGDDWQTEASFPPENYQTYDEGDRNIVDLLKHAIVEP